MGTNTMREQFEAWVLREWPEQSLARFTTGEYQGFTVEHCWQAWKSSREAVVIDLSKAMIAGGGYFEDQDAIAAIEAQGLKVAP